jgi:hypothetical protein
LFHIFVSIEKLLGDDIQILALLINFHSHIIHDGINPKIGLLDFIKHFLLLSKYLALDFIIKFDMILNHPILFLIGDD